MMKLTYFNGRGRAELARLVFAQAGVKYEDIRIEGTFDQLKASGKLPFQQLPILETASGELLAQSRAITMYVAEECGLAGKTNIEKAKVNMVLDAIADIFAAMLKFYFEKDETRKEEFKKNFGTNVLPTNLAGLEKVLSANNGGNGYFVGTSVTVADLGAYNLLSNLKNNFPEDFNPFKTCPKVEALVKRVGALPKIAEWVKKRPETSF